MHQLRPRHTGVNRHGVVVALDDDDDLLQPVYQEPYQNHRATIALNIDPKNKDNHSASASSASDQDNDFKNCASVEPATLQLVRKGRTTMFYYFIDVYTGIPPRCLIFRKLCVAEGK